jgi:hypothetical protein
MLPPSAITKGRASLIHDGGVRLVGRSAVRAQGSKVRFADNSGIECKVPFCKCPNNRFYGHLAKTQIDLNRSISAKSCGC